MTSPHEPQKRPGDLAPLNMASPPWWDAWQGWEAARDPDTEQFVEERDPREALRDVVAYELAVLAFGGGWELLLADLARCRNEVTMFDRVKMLQRQLKQYQERVHAPR